MTPRAGKPLLPHQLAAYRFIISRPASAVWLDVGAAKSRVTLEALEALRPTGHTLIIAPLQIARNSWTGEIDKWGFRVRVRSLVDHPHTGGRRGGRLDTAERAKLYAELRDPATPPTLWVTSLSLLVPLVEAMGFDIDGHPTDPPPPGALWPFPTVVIDEAQEFKNSNSTRFKALYRVRLQISRIIELTGTPSPQSLLDLWAQMALLDGGAALGDNFYKFRLRYFEPDRYVDKRPVTWKLRPGAEAAIHAAIQHLAISRRNTSHLKPPDPVISTAEVHLDDDTQQQYRTFMRERVLELAPDLLTAEVPVIAADTAAHLRAVLLQFASGTVYRGEDHKTQFDVIHDAKLEALVQILAAATSPVMVAYRFQADQTRLLSELRARGFAAEKFNGRPEMVRRWNNREIPVMLLQPASSGRGLNLQHGGNTIVWYTLPDSLEHWTQTNGRLVRIGQTDPVRIIRLVTSRTVDELQVPRLRRKSTTQDDLLRAVRNTLLQPVSRTNR